MKSYDETIETVFKRIEEYEAAQKKKRKSILPISASQYRTSCQTDEDILDMEGTAKQGSRDFGEGDNYKAVSILPQRKRHWKHNLSRGFMHAGLSLAACAAIVLIVWIPIKLSNTAETTDSPASTVFEESVVQTDMVSSSEAAESSESDAFTESAAAADGNFFTEMFGEAIAMYAFTPDFSDSDGHVVIQAEQMLTDKSNIYLVVSYEYLDEIGKDWIENYFMNLSKNDRRKLLSIMPVFKENNTRKYGVNWGIDCKNAEEAGLEEYETAAKKYFLLTCECDSDRFGTDSVKLDYTLPGTVKYANVEMTNYVPKTVYRIEADVREDKCYVPAQVTITPFGIVIEGKYRDIVWADYDPYSWRTMRNPDSLKLVFQDDTSWNLLNSDNCEFVCYGASPYAEEQIYDDIDCPVFSSSFNKPIDVEQVKGIWINGVYYELK